MQPDNGVSKTMHAPLVDQSALAGSMAAFLTEKIGLVDVDLSRSLQENGGDSLAATLLSAHLRSRFNVDCTAARLLGRQSLAEVSTRLEYDAGALIEAAPAADAYPLSDQQSGVAFDQIRTPLGKQYNLPLYVETGADFDFRRFRRCMLSALKRHAGLRMRMVLKDARLMQCIEAFDEADFVVEDRGVATDLQDELARFCQPFQLEEGPLYRVAKVACADKMYLLFDMHHIVTDGYSKKLLFDHINALYAGQYPALPSLAYIDYSCWVDQQKCLPGRAVSLEYWKTKLFPLPPPLDLPTDYARPAVRSTEAGCVRASLGAADVAELGNVARSAGATLYEALIASYSVAIACIANADDLILGSPSLGRNVSGTSETVGMFASTACYRIKPDIEDTFISHLQKVADEVRITTQQEFFPMDDLVKVAAQANPAPMARHPIFDLMLAFHARQLVNVELDGHPVIWEPAATRSTIFDLHMHIFERPDQLDIQLLFNSSIFSRQTASDLLAAYLEVIKKLTSCPAQSMASIL
ncbi:hypothetical protein JOE11_005262 [Robbsia andropogonis]|uniref:condensation domain-containing protein n=1 Tax=Robbsia andropogonis TaxID=28092 RepID=UPI003D1CAFB1